MAENISKKQNKTFKLSEPNLWPREKLGKKNASWLREELGTNLISDQSHLRTGIFESVPNMADDLKSFDPGVENSCDKNQSAVRQEGKTKNSLTLELSYKS